MNEGIKKYSEKLTEEHVNFILGELPNKETNPNKWDEEYLESVYDLVCDIETFETPLDYSIPLPERIKIAGDIVTLLGQAYAVTDEE